MGEEAFLALSKALTGEPDLSPLLARQHMQRLEADSAGAHLKDLLDVFEAIEAEPAADREALIQSRIVESPTLWPVAATILKLWYTGDPVPDPRVPVGRSAEAYFEGLIWKVALAHPPALSGGYFGHWSYPPEGA